jgi:hypothetical protein
LSHADGRCFEPIEGGVPAGGEFPKGVTGPAKEVLNRLVAAAVAVTNQGTRVPEAQRSGMDGRVRVQEEVTIGVRIGITLGVDCFLAKRAARAFALGIWGYVFRGSW